MPNETYYYATGSEVTSIADAIRAKTGKSAAIEFPDEFVEEIESITGSNNKTEWVIIHQGTYSITSEDGGETGYFTTSTDPFEPIEYGSVWRITWNGTPYICTATEVAYPIATEYAEGYAIGNMIGAGGTTGNNEPFIACGCNFWGEHPLTFLTYASSGIILLVVEKQVVTSSINTMWHTEYRGNVLVVDMGDPNGYVSIEDYFPDHDDFTLGEIYRITWNGQLYLCSPYRNSSENTNQIGNGVISGGTIGNNEPFVGLKYWTTYLLIETTDPVGEMFTLIIEKQVARNGLEYEEGTWTPASDVASYTISFTNTHTVAPFAFAVFDVEGTASNTTDDNLCLTYFNGGQFFGTGAYISSSKILYANVAFIFKNSATTDSYGRVIVTEPYTDAGDSSSSYSRYWATETGIKAYIGSNSRYWRSGRTYKWIAVWAPSSS